MSLFIALSYVSGFIPFVILVLLYLIKKWRHKKRCDVESKFEGLVYYNVIIIILSYFYTQLLPNG